MNALICFLRATWYRLTEGPRLRWARFTNELGVEWAWGRKPLISVYIPTHNRVDILLNRALPSVLAQTYKNIEIIVACHGCTDGTYDRVAAYSYHRLGEGLRKIHPIIVPRKLHYPDTPENRWFAGPVDPANAALKECRGDFIARIDDDDTWEPDHLEKLLEFAQAGNYEFVSSAHDTHEGPVKPYILGEQGLGIPGTKVGGCQTWLYRSYLKFFRYNRDCYRKEHDRVNDTDLQQRMHDAGVKMGYLDRVTAHVLPRPGETEVGLKAYLAKAG